MEIRRQLHTPGEVASPLQADPEGFGTGRPIVLAPQVAAQSGDPTEHDGQRRRGHRRWPVVNRDVDGLPFGRVQDRIARQVGGGPPQQGQVLNPPGDDQIQSQGRFQPLQGAQLQRFHAAAGFENSKKNLDIPLAIPLYH